MKFICESCNTKYTIADEKIRGKVLKIRCKACQNIITVRESPEVAARARPAPAQPLQSALDGALTGQPPVDSRTAVTPMPGLVEPPEWYFSRAGVQEGPMTLDAVAARVALYRPTDEVYVWRDGFDDWIPGYNCPELRPILRKLAPPPPTARPPVPAATRSSQRLPIASGPSSPQVPVASAASGPVPRAAGQPAAALSAKSQRSGPVAAPSQSLTGRIAVPVATVAPEVRRPMSSPSDEGDPSEAFAAQLAQKERYDEAAAAMAREAAYTPNAGGSSASRGSGTSDSGFLIDEPSRVVRMPVGLPPARRGPAPPSASQAFFAQSSSASASQAFFAQGAAGVSGPLPAALGPATRHRKSGALKFFLVAGAAAILAVVVTVVMLLNGSTAHQPSASIPAGAREDDNSLEINTGGTVAKASRHGPVAPTALAARTAPKVTPGGTTAQSPIAQPSAPPAPDPPRAQALPGNLGRLAGAANDTSADDPVGPKARAWSEDALHDVVRQGEGNLQLCYQSALRHNPGLGRIKVDVDVAFAASGNVINVGLPDDLDPGLASCLGRLIRNWDWPPKGSEYHFEFPVVFRPE